MMTDETHQIKPCSDSENCMALIFGRLLDGTSFDCRECLHYIYAADQRLSRFRSIDGKPHSQDASRKRPTVSKQGQNKPKDKVRQDISHDASKSEEGAYTRAVTKSSNSGRLRKDGDFAIGEILMDNKKQFTKVLKVDPKELDKAKMDANRSGKKIAALTMENVDNKRYVVMSEDDFFKLVF